MNTSDIEKFVYEQEQRKQEFKNALRKLIDESKNNADLLLIDEGDKISYIFKNNYKGSIDVQELASCFMTGEVKSNDGYEKIILQFVKSDIKKQIWK